MTRGSEGSLARAAAFSCPGYSSGRRSLLLIRKQCPRAGDRVRGASKDHRLRA